MNIASMLARFGILNEGKRLRFQMPVTFSQKGPALEPLPEKASVAQVASTTNELIEALREQGILSPLPAAESSDAPSTP